MKNKKLVSLMMLSASAVMALAACGGGDPATSSSGSVSNRHFTYNTYLDSNPKTWNPHAWETNSDSYILSFTEMGFYDLGFNADKSGYEFICEMASDFPVDVTSELSKDEKARYFGRSSINLPSGIAYDIPLNDKACWEDGTPITADDYIESMKRLLDPEYVNHRADSWYKGNTVLANAEAYFKKGQITVEPAYNYIKDDPDLNSTDPNFAFNDVWYVNLGGDSPFAGAIFSNIDSGMFYTVLRNRGTTLAEKYENAADRIYNAVGEGLIKIRRDGYLGEDAKSSDWINVETVSDIKTDDSNNMFDYNISQYDFDDLDLKRVGEKIVNEAEYEKEGKDLPDDYEPYLFDDLTSDISLFLSGLNSPRGLANKTNAWRLPLFAEYENEDTGVDFSNVGIEKINDHKIRLIMAADSPVSMTDLKFSLTSNWIVKTDLYDALSSHLQGSDLMVTKYGTASAANYRSFGPYKLTTFQDDKLIILERNEKWYGYSDGKHEGEFQTEAINTQIVSSHSTALLMFEKGQIDDIELTASDMKTYGASSRLKYTPTSYTQKMSFNVTRGQLLKRQQNAPGTHPGNKTILANEDFRKAISLSIDRKQYAAQCTAGSEGFTGLLNSLYISDVDNGEYYRGTQQGKSVYGKLYGHLGGSTIDEEHGEPLAEKQRGYNLTLAGEYLKRAIETENASTDDGHFSKGDTVAIEILVYQSDSETTKASYDFISKSLKALADEVNEAYDSQVISFDYYMTQNENYYDEAKKGAYDVIFSTWGGAQMNPWGLMEVYCDPSFDSNCEYGMVDRVKSIYLTFDYNGDGVEETRSIADWYNFLNSLVEISPADYDMDDPESVAQYELDRVQRHFEKLNVLSELEVGYLNTWATAPILSRSSASLTSFKVQEGTDSYIPLMGYGGIRYMTFNYDDAEWAAAIASGEITPSDYIN